MRSHYNAEELEAARLLDLVRAGVNVPQEAITRALWILGDLVNVRIHHD
ncbi:MAG: hypothetical protein KGL39_42725 [Patescibacteria group bacterium]|nr:hypothetical protein [Patescibacteria group bacterium]